jgi:hypothetical protein
MRNHSSANGVPEPTARTDPDATEPPDADRLTNRVLELERALDIQAAIVRQMVARLDRLEREAAMAPGPEPRADIPAAADTVPTRVRLDETWSWVRARLGRGRG